MALSASGLIFNFLIWLHFFSQQKPEIDSLLFSTFKDSAIQMSSKSFQP